MLRILSSPCREALTLLLRLYQIVVSPLLGPRCRFYPSCSHYAQECLALYPLPQAIAKVIRRVFSCHPFHPGGVDLP